MSSNNQKVKCLGINHFIICFYSDTFYVTEEAKLWKDFYKKLVDNKYSK